MANNVGLEFAAKTDTGLVRAQNEDAIALSPDYGFAVLADGMGGYNAGEVASGIAIATVRQSMEEGLDELQGHQGGLLTNRPKQIQQLMIDSIRRANAAIFDAAKAEPACQGMGTTVVAALFHHDRLMLAHVGDSRAYRFRPGELLQLTRDHSLLQEQIDAGLISPEWARFSQNKNLVTRAVGVGPEVEVEIHEHLVEAGDVYLLCSDGLSDMLLPEEIEDLLANQQTSLEQVCDALVQRANANGGHDNISAILIRVRSTVAEPDSLLGRILGWIK
ncbi:MAG TPA: Stp1/IreP family PP2C-type Ser/Thr phosphatase [Noviherbaspirillum sp.]|uniref:Stp1/IreP family PP2C-type Ser/Thr phosphatase n=1 Tax=Noviherbaspirillum sp. TaxID=1926288 RepID=UPI002B470116|nr:Stp1/IreP family PP2C-type Ser/Thr phosphatase [Noviherbaspirillum sp.]HJV83976.1 Stp1/IreP family PP2C-type Ser/Thr phosphatase [Noviherbaspirillum sp.]